MQSDTACPPVTCENDPGGHSKGFGELTGQ